MDDPMETRPSEGPLLNFGLEIQDSSDFTVPRLPSGRRAIPRSMRTISLQVRIQLNESLELK